MEYKGEIEIAGKKYLCEVKDGVRYIDGKTVDEFFESLPITDLCEYLMLAKTGTMALDAERRGEQISPTKEYKKMRMNLT